jgi:hypothetical protein
MKLHRDRAGDRIKELGKNLFGVSGTDETIQALEEYFSLITSPVRLSQTSYGAYDKKDIIATMSSNDVSGSNHKLSSEDYRELVDLMW